MAANPTDESEIFVEFVVQGSVVKATAIHSKSGTEVSIVGPASAPRLVLQTTAVQKLRYVLKKSA